MFTFETHLLRMYKSEVIFYLNSKIITFTQEYFKKYYMSIFSCSSFDSVNSSRIDKTWSIEIDQAILEACKAGLVHNKVKQPFIMCPVCPGLLSSWRI